MVVLVKGSIRNSTDVHVPTLWTLAMIGVMQSFQPFLDTFCDASVMNRAVEALSYYPPIGPFVPFTGKTLLLASSAVQVVARPGSWRVPLEMLV